jgi:hypothetical protein
MEKLHNASVAATSRPAAVLWSKRQGNKVPLQFEPLARKLIHKKSMERRPAVLNFPPPPEEDVEPARFKEDMEQSQRNLEETYRTHMAAKAKEKLMSGKKTAKRSGKRLAKRVFNSEASLTKPVLIPAASNKPMVKPAAVIAETVHRPAVAKKPVVKSAAFVPEQVRNPATTERVVYPGQKGCRLPTEQELLEVAITQGDECIKRYCKNLDALEFQASASAHRKLANKGLKRHASQVVTPNEIGISIPNVDGDSKATTDDSADKTNSHNSQVLLEDLTEEDTLAVNKLLQARKNAKLNPPVVHTHQVTSGGDYDASIIHERSQSSLPPILAGGRMEHKTDDRAISYLPRERTDKRHVEKLLHDGVPEFTGKNQSYEKWRKIFRNKISCSSPNADDVFWEDG